MKIYYNGCSNTEGRGHLENYKEVRWSAQLSKSLNAEEVNEAECGGSNIRLLRSITQSKVIDDCDLAIIQFTFPNRTEYFDEDNNKYQTVICGEHQTLPKPKGQKNNILSRIGKKINYDNKIWELENSEVKNLFWLDYFRKIYHEKYGKDYESMVYTSLKAIMKEKCIPTLFISCYDGTKMDYDFMMSRFKYPRGDDEHLNAPAQKMIADDLLKVIYSKNYDLI